MGTNRIVGAHEKRVGSLFTDVEAGLSDEEKNARLDIKV